MSAHITHIAADAAQEELLHYMATDGAVILDDVLGKERLTKLDLDLAPFLRKQVYGRDAFTGFRTQRIGALIARSQACGELALIWRSTAMMCNCTSRLPWLLRQESPHKYCIEIGASGVAMCRGKSNHYSALSGPSRPLQNRMAQRRLWSAPISGKKDASPNLTK